MQETVSDSQPAAAAADAPAPAPAPRSIGERLRAGRERAGLSLPAAAEKLHLDPRVIEALEADRFTELGATVYVRGHLRRYGDFVGESGAELVSLYLAREADTPSPDLTQIPQAERHSRPRGLLMPLAGVACAAVLAGAIWWVLKGQGTGVATDTANEDVASRVPSPAETLAAPPPSEASESAAGAPAPSSGPAVAVPVAATAAPPTAAPVPAPSAAAAAPAAETPPAGNREVPPARPTQLRLQLTGDSWVEVYDSRGERLFADVASAGSVQSLEGRPPLRVVLGNAAAVSVQVNGEARDIPATAIAGDEARFVVNRSGTLSRSRQ